MNNSLSALLATALVCASAAPAGAQYGPNPYYPPPYLTGQGSTLAGAAQVIGAGGQLQIDQENARIIRQQGYQEKIKTKKQAFDEAAYEKANTPSFTEEQDKVQALRIRRMMNQPNPYEIANGDCLNTLMPFIKALSDQGVPGPPVPINPYLLRSINVGVPGAGGGETSVGLLKNGGKLAWPLQLRGPNQQKIDALLPKACSQAAAGTLEPATYTQLTSLVGTMQDDAKTRFRKDELDGSSYLAGKKYLVDLASNLKVLQNPDAAKFLTGSYSAQGGTVPELVDNMTAQGLQFAAASPGSEAAYRAVYNAFVSYARAAQSGSGFQSSLSTPQAPFKK